MGYRVHWGALSHGTGVHPDPGHWGAGSQGFREQGTRGAEYSRLEDVGVTEPGDQDTAIQRTGVPRGRECLGAQG